MDGAPEVVRPKSRRFTRYKVVSDGAGWSLDWDARHVSQALEGLGLKRSRLPSRKTVLYFTSRDHFLRFTPLLKFVPARTVIVDHFHGTPYDDPKYAKYFAAYKKHREKLFGIRITNTTIQQFFEAEGLGELSRILRIPVDTTIFNLSNANKFTRADLGIGEDSAVLGSFQKDGLGWGTGNEPKLEKGPDLLVSVITSLDKLIDNLHVLLTGPARGFVFNALEASNVKVTWRKEIDHYDIPAHYRVLDAYLITSRLEGGPKAALESLASGVPLVSTPVGQVTELGLTRCHGIVTTGLDIDELIESVLEVLKDGGNPNCKKQLADENNLAAFQLNLQRWLFDQRD